MLGAAVLIAGINLEVDLIGLFRRARVKPPEVVCGIKVVGYHFIGQPGQKFEYAGETFTVPSERFVELVAERRVQHYTFEGQKLPLESGQWPLDGFSFRWITLPSSEKGEPTDE